MASLERNHTKSSEEISLYQPHLKWTSRLISVLPVFSKILEKIMHNRFYKYFVENKILFLKQFCFQISTSTEHTILG